MKFSIISDIHFGKEEINKGIIRKLSRFSLKFLDNFISEMNGVVKPSFVVNLGDAINDTTHDEDVENYGLILERLATLQCPVHNLIGNHEQRTLSEGELESLINHSPLYYSFDNSEYHFIILYSDDRKKTRIRINDTQVAWLKRDLSETDKKTFVFVHHPLSDQDLTGNFWFDGRPNRALVENRKDVRKILEQSRKVIAVFNGHVHWNKMDVHNGIPYFSIQSLVENFQNDGKPSVCFANVECTDEAIGVNVRGVDSANYRYEFKRK